MEKELTVRMKPSPSVAVLPQTAVREEVVRLGALALDAGSVHLADAADLVVGVAPAAQAGLQRHVGKINTVRRTR